jgi:hypothetical protein
MADGDRTEAEARPVLELRTTPEIEKVLADQMPELPKLALEKARERPFSFLLHVAIEMLQERPPDCRAVACDGNGLPCFDRWAAVREMGPVSRTGSRSPRGLGPGISDGRNPKSNYEQGTDRSAQ